MKVLIGFAVAVFAVATVGYLARAKLAALPAKMEAMMEQCPPIKAMRKLEEQNAEVIELLRHEGTETPAAPAVAEPI